MLTSGNDLEARLRAFACEAAESKDVRVVEESGRLAGDSGDAAGKVGDDANAVAASTGKGSYDDADFADDYVARPHPDRARQFAPFAALRGYAEMVRLQEAVPESRRELTEEEADTLSRVFATMERGDMVEITYYRDDRYVTFQGKVSNIDTVFRTITVVKTRIPFDNIRTISLLRWKKS